MLLFGSTEIKYNSIQFNRGKPKLDKWKKKWMVTLILVSINTLIELVHFIQYIDFGHCCFIAAVHKLFHITTKLILFPELSPESFSVGRSILTPGCTPIIYSCS